MMQCNTIWEGGKSVLAYRDDVRELSGLIQDEHVKVVVFDLDGTLYPSTAGIEAQLRPLMVKTAARWLSVGEDEAHMILLKYRRAYRASVIGLERHHKIDGVAFLQDVYDALDESQMTQRPGLVDALTALSHKVPLAVFTNSNRTFTDRALRRLDLKHLFTHVVTVEDNHFVRKPEVDAYHNLYTILNVSAHEVLMFDDIVSSLEVMQSQGSRTALVSNGLRAYPHFYDLHTNKEYIGTPGCVDISTHDLVGTIQKMLVLL